MAHLALTSPLAPVVAAVEGLRRLYPDQLRCVTPGLVIANRRHWWPGSDPQAVAVIVVAGWTGARRIPLLGDEDTYLNDQGQLGIVRARVAVLPDDPVAGAPGVLVAGNREELIALVIDHAGAAPETIRRLSSHHQQRDLHLRRGA